MIDRGFPEVEEFINKMGAALVDSIRLRKTAREVQEAKQRRGGTEVYSMDPFVAIGTAFQLIAQLSVNPQIFAEKLDNVAAKTAKTATQHGATDAIRFCMGKELESMLQ